MISILFQLNNQVDKLEEKLWTLENLLEHKVRDEQISDGLYSYYYQNQITRTGFHFSPTYIKKLQNLEIKKLSNERRDAIAAQYAAEATLQRVYMNQKDHDLHPIESVLAPLEAELKIYKNEVNMCRSVIVKTIDLFE